MTAYFQYRDENSIITRCKNGTEVIVYFSGGEPCDISMDDNYWVSHDDALHDYGAFVQDGSKPNVMLSLADLCIFASYEYPEIMAEVQREADNEARHQKSMSDSGRYI